MMLNRICPHIAPPTMFLHSHSKGQGIVKVHLPYHWLNTQVMLLVDITTLSRKRICPHVTHSRPTIFLHSHSKGQGIMKVHLPYQWLNTQVLLLVDITTLSRKSHYQLVFALAKAEIRSALFLERNGCKRQSCFCTVAALTWAVW